MTVREPVEQFIVVTQHLRLTRKHVDEVTTRAALEPWHHLAPQPHPAIVHVLVHRIVDGREAQKRADLLRVGSAQLQQGPAHCSAAGCHAGKSGETTPAQKVEQHRFGLIIASVAEQYRVAVDCLTFMFEGAKTHITGSRFEIAAGVDVDGDHARLGAEPLCSKCDDGRLVRCAETVIDIHRDNVESRVACEREQRQRISTSGAPRDNPCAGLEIVEREKSFGPVRERAGSHATQLSADAVRARRRHAPEPCRGIVELDDRWQILGTDPCHVDGTRAGRVHDAPHEALTDLVLPHLLLETEQLLQLRGNPDGFAPLLQHALHPFFAGDVTAAELAHHDVAVALQQRHQGLHLGEHAPLLRRREQGDETAFVERVASTPHFLDRLRHRSEEGARVRVHQPQGFVHQREEVLAHPWHTGELRPVRHLVDRDPQAEVARPERESLLEPEDVGADVIDGVAARIVGNQQVVLAENALREVTEQQAEFARRHVTADGSERVTRKPLGEPLHQRREQPSHRRDVRVDPVSPVEDPRRDVPGSTEARVVADQRFGLHRQRVEVRGERAGEIRVRERLAARDESSNAARGAPVDRIRSPNVDLGLSTAMNGARK